MTSCDSQEGATSDIVLSQGDEETTGSEAALAEMTDRDETRTDIVQIREGREEMIEIGAEEWVMIGIDVEDLEAIEIGVGLSWMKDGLEEDATM